MGNGYYKNSPECCFNSLSSAVTIQLVRARYCNVCLAKAGYVLITLQWDSWIKKQPSLP